MGSAFAQTCRVGMEPHGVCVPYAEPTLGQVIPRSVSLSVHLGLLGGHCLGSTCSSSTFYKCSPEEERTFSATQMGQ